MSGPLEGKGGRSGSEEPRIGTSVEESALLLNEPLCTWRGLEELEGPEAGGDCG